MNRHHRRAHRLAWLVLTPVLLLLILLMSNPARDLHPRNDGPPPGIAKGALP